MRKEKITERLNDLVPCDMFQRRMRMAVSAQKTTCLPGIVWVCGDRLVGALETGEYRDKAGIEAEIG